ncbi:MAG: cysteine synthase A [Acidobacteriia bacterium]|nr:cysteine synthase A [Terriglobia bacterium]
MHLSRTESIQDLIGNTPILHLEKICKEPAAAIWVKMETFNPGGSIKDRTAVGLIRDAEAGGHLKKGGTIIEPTAGNTGVGLALIGVKLGYRVILMVPEGFSQEKMTLMRALGGEVVITPRSEGMEGAIRRAFEKADQIPDSYVPQQFENPSNPKIHYETTGPEIFQQMDGKVDAIAIGAGTGGTFTGVARYLKERIPTLWAAVVEPQGSIFGGGKAGSHKVEGIGNSFVPKTLDMGLADEVVTVMDADSFATLKRLAHEEGVLAGGSGGANVFAAVQIAKRLGPGKNVVTIIPDSGERYLSKNIFD